MKWKTWLLFIKVLKSYWHIMIGNRKVKANQKYITKHIDMAASDQKGTLRSSFWRAGSEIGRVLYRSTYLLTCTQLYPSQTKQSMGESITPSLLRWDLVMLCYFPVRYLLSCPSSTPCQALCPFPYPVTCHVHYNVLYTNHALCSSLFCTLFYVKVGESGGKRGFQFW